MTEVENEENVKNTIQDTQILIRNHMQQHKKISKQLHSQIKKDQHGSKKVRSGDKRNGRRN